MRSRNPLIAVGIAVLLASHLGFAQNDASKALVDQAQYWQSKGNNARAAEAWKKLLLVEPNNAQAYYGLGSIEVKNNRSQAANEYLAKLKAIDPNSRYSLLLEQDIQLNNPITQSELEKANALVQSSTASSDREGMADALKIYNSVLNGKLPQGAFALEYYNVQSFTQNGVKPARIGLERLLKENPNDARVDLALAGVEIRDESTRTAGVQRLQRLSKVPSVSSDATEFWRNSLGWFGPNPKALPLIEAYLKAHPEDAEVRAQYNAIKNKQQSDTVASKKSEGSNLQKSPELMSPEDLEKSSVALNAELANSAIRRGDEALRVGDDNGARLAFEEALGYAPNNIWTCYKLANLYIKSGHPKEAQALMDEMLNSQPTNTDALYASALMANSQREPARALAILDQVPGKQRKGAILELQKSAWLEYQIELATNLIGQGRKSEAIQVLTQAEPVAVASKNIGAQGAIANAFYDAGQPTHAFQIIRQLESRSKPPTANIELQYASLLLKANRDAECATVLKKIQAMKLDEDQRKLFNDMVFNYSLRQASLLQERGDLAASYDRLVPLLQQRPNDIGANNLLASLYATNSNYKQALDISKSLVQNDPQNIDLLLATAQYASQANDYSYADSLLQSAMSIAPNNSKVFETAARIYRSQGKNATAEPLFERAIALKNQPTPASQTLASQAAGTKSTTLINTSSNNPFLPQAAPIYVENATQSPSSAPVIANQSSFQTYDNVQSPAAYASNKPQMVVNKTAKTAATKVADTAAISDAALNAPEQAKNTTPAVVIPSPITSFATSTPTSAPTPTSVAAQPFDKSIPPATTKSDLFVANSTSTPVQISGTPTPGMSNFPSVNIPASQNPARQNLPSTTVQSTYTPPSMTQELDAIKRERSAEVLVGAQIRNRNGSAGTSSMTDIETPMEARFAAGEGKMNVTVTPVFLNSGTIPNSNYNLTTFGSGLPTGTINNQSATGVGVAVGYKIQGVTIDIGATPIGFTYTNPTGGVKLEGMLDDVYTVYGAVNVSSRPVTDSVLSFSGTTDNRTNQSWGGVMASGARGFITKDLGGWGILGSIGYYGLNGHNTLSNTRTDFLGGAYIDLIRKPDYFLTTGLNYNYVTYKNNENFFTYGQGGYYSPQRSNAFTVPINWSQRSDKLTYQVRGALGYQSSYNNSAPYFPTSNALQTANGNPVYVSSTGSGIAYGLGAAAEQRIAPQWYLGANAQTDNTASGTAYHQWGAGVYLRYSFYSGIQPMALPVNIFTSPYSQ